MPTDDTPAPFNDDLQMEELPYTAESRRPKADAREMLRKFLHRASTIAPELLNEDMANLPGDLSWANEEYARAYETQIRADADLDNVRAILGIDHRRRILTVTSKATERMIEEAVTLDPRYIHAKNAAITAEVALVQAKGRVELVRAKRDMLQSIGANLRAEMSMDPSLRATKSTEAAHARAGWRDPQDG